jgi:hypothetical protein
LQAVIVVAIAARYGGFTVFFVEFPVTFLFL